MPTSQFDLIEGDIDTVINITLVDESDVAIDITGATLTWHWQHGKKAPVTKTATISNGPGGITTYTSIADDIKTEDLRVQVEALLPGGWRGRSDPVNFKVGRKLIKGL